MAYVFLDLMPDLAEQQSLIERVGLFPGLDRHIYILALVGLTVSLWVETASRESRRRRRAIGEPDQTGTAAFWLSIVSFMVLNAAIGYAVASPGDRAVEPLWMFAVAMGLHFLANDHSLVEHHGERYQRIGRWLLVAGLITGWLIGTLPAVEIRPDILALVLAYIAGGTIMNILRHELPDTDRSERRRRLRHRGHGVRRAAALAVAGRLTLSVCLQTTRSTPQARRTGTNNASAWREFGTRVPSGSGNTDSLGFSGASESRPFRVIATESCETRWSEAGSIPTASTKQAQ